MKKPKTILAAENPHIAAFREKHHWPLPEDAPNHPYRRYPAEDILDRLRQRYTGDEVPPCRVCGGELSVQSMGGGQATKYAHSAPDGVKIMDWMEHYHESTWVQYREGDSEVLALLDLVEELQYASSENET